MRDPDDLSVQLYTVRRLLAEDVDSTLAELAAMGFRQVEAFDLIAYRDRLRDALPRHGLRAPFAHVDLLSNELADVADAAHALGVTTVVQPWTDPQRWQTGDGIAELADALTDVAARAANEELRVAYHNHHFELATKIDGRHALEIFAERVRPSVALEVDAYWAFAGGADVPALLERLGEHVVGLHIKDGDGSLDTAHQVPAGAGAAPIAAVLDAAPHALPIVEFDETPGEILDAIRASRSYVLGLVSA